MNIKKLTKIGLKFLSTEFPERYHRVKCKRDLTYILSAIEKDVRNETTTFINRVANKFWYNGNRLINTHEVEIAVYRHLEANLKEMLSKSEFKYAKKSIDLLCQVITDGPFTILLDTGSQLVQASIAAEHCQRNWDYSKSIPEADIDALISIATNMPTKQNREYYKLVVSTDLDLNQQILKHAIDGRNPDTVNRNLQVSAHLLLIYINKKHVDVNNVFIDHEPTNRQTAIGISSGAVALAATHLGYRTGFCQCFINEGVENEIAKKGVELLEDCNGVQLLLGIGIPKDEHNWNQVVNGETVERSIRVLAKSIEVIKI